jgi:tRNA A37 methylthiotransferase MiaB
MRRARARALHELCAVLRADFLDAHLGRTLPVLIEGTNTDAAGPYAAGFTPNYLPVRLRDVPAAAVGRIVPARLLAHTDDGSSLEARIDAAGTRPAP